MTLQGANDDDSGIITVPAESHRALLKSDSKPNHTAEFHWYSAEVRPLHHLCYHEHIWEAGLLGSQAVANDYKARGVKVVAMSQFSVTAWVKKGARADSVDVITDHTDSKLTQFSKGLVEDYLSIPYVETKCGYASWEKTGYPAIFTIGGSFANPNPHIHTANG